MIASDLTSQQPMLATATTNPDQLVAELDKQKRWSFDIKWDGIRCLTFIDDGTVRLVGRSGTDMTHKYPDIVRRLREVYPTGSRVFDGEIICFDPATGKPSFNRVQKRDKQATERRIAECVASHPATLMVFDQLLGPDGDLRFTPLVHRQLVLAKEAAGWGTDDRRLMLSQWSDYGVNLWEFVKISGLEGLIAKDKTSPYRGRRDSCWLKLKSCHRITCIVTGYENGRGARDGKVGALLLSLLDADGKLVQVGKVGTGLKEADHAPLLACLHRGEEFLVEVEVLGFHEALRMPSFKGVRTDVQRADCTLTQLDSLGG